MYLFSAYELLGVWPLEHGRCQFVGFRGEGHIPQDLKCILHIHSNNVVSCDEVMPHEATHLAEIKLYVFPDRQSRCIVGLHEAMSPSGYHIINFIFKRSVEPVYSSTG